jgi:hypothetical protein
LEGDLLSCFAFTLGRVHELVDFILIKFQLVGTDAVGKCG